MNNLASSAFLTRHLWKKSGVPSRWLQRPTLTNKSLTEVCSPKGKKMPRKALRVVSPAGKDTRHKVWRCPGDWDGGHAGRAETSNCVWGPIRVPPRSGQNKQAGETGARLSPAQMTQGGRLRPETAQAVVGFGLTKLLQQGLSNRSLRKWYSSLGDNK